MEVSGDSGTEIRARADSAAADQPGYRSVISRYEVIGIVRKVMALFPVSAAALCGSFARNEQSASSDIDLLVAFDSGFRLGDVEDARLALEYATGRKVDLITSLEGQMQLFKNSVLKDGIKVYERA